MYLFSINGGVLISQYKIVIIIIILKLQKLKCILFTVHYLVKYTLYTYDFMDTFHVTQENLAYTRIHQNIILN